MAASPTERIPRYPEGFFGSVMPTLQLVPSGFFPRVWMFPASDTMPLVTPFLRMASTAYFAAQPLAQLANVSEPYSGNVTAYVPDVGNLEIFILSMHSSFRSALISSGAGM